MSSLNPRNIILNNCISGESATWISGYSKQYPRRMLRLGKLAGMKLGQQWLIKLESLETYLEQAAESKDLHFGPNEKFLNRHVYVCKRKPFTSVYTLISKEKSHERYGPRCWQQHLAPHGDLTPIYMPPSRLVKVAVLEGIVLQ